MSKFEYIQTGGVARSFGDDIAWSASRLLFSASHIRYCVPQIKFSWNVHFFQNNSTISLSQFTSLFFSGHQGWDHQPCQVYAHQIFWTVLATQRDITRNNRFFVSVLMLFYYCTRKQQSKEEAMSQCLKAQSEALLLSLLNMFPVKSNSLEMIRQIILSLEYKFSIKAKTKLLAYQCFSIYPDAELLARPRYILVWSFLLPRP